MSAKRSGGHKPQAGLRVALCAALIVSVSVSAASLAAGNMPAPFRIAQGSPGGPVVPGPGGKGFDIPGFPKGAIPGVPEPKVSPRPDIPGVDAPGFPGVPDGDIGKNPGTREERERREEEERNRLDELTRELQKEPRPTTRERDPNAPPIDPDEVAKRPPPPPTTVTRDPVTPPPIIPVTPPDNPPPHVPEDPPTITYDEDKTAPCCGINRNRISYPLTSDPMEIPKEPVAPRDVATGAYQVLLHNGAFFQNQQDIGMAALAFKFDWTRHWKGKVAFQDGGIMGYGWDLSYNKRIVPFATRRLPNGLQFEEIGVDQANLTYYDGQVNAEIHTETHSEVRRIFNFDTRFEARVTTYRAPNGAFHEIERYILTGTSPHPFGDHPNVEPGEKIFYVLREKNGTRYVFNCRGQLIYILSRNDSNAKRIRVELQYGGALNPLTQNKMLSKIIDASGHTFTVDTVNIHDGQVFTNIGCKLVTGKYPVPRIRSVTGAGYWVEYKYRNNDNDPVLEAAVLHTDVDQRWEYKYDAANRLTEQKTPVECAKGADGKPYFVNKYDGQGRVTAQTMGGYTTTIGYGGTVTVTDADKSVKEYTLERIGDYPVVQSLTVKDEKEGAFTTAYRHNSDTQVTRLTNPLQNGVAYEYAPSNASVTLGPIRDWEGKYTYESDLARGNLLTVTLFGKDGKTDGAGILSTTESFEHLYNQLEDSIDAAGNVTKRTYLYDRPGDRGNPKTVKGPPVAQPAGAPMEAATLTFTYNEFGQVESEDRGGGRVTRFKYDGRHYLERTDFPGGGYETYTPNQRGEIMEQGGTGGTVVYVRNNRGLVTSKTVGPENLHIRTSYEYDLNNNETKVTLRVEDAYGDSAARYGLFEQIGTDRVVRSRYDILDRRIAEITEADKKTLTTTYKYGPGDHIVEVHAPPLAATGELFTKYAFNARGMVVEKTEAFGTRSALTTKNVYNENGNLVGEEMSGDKLSSAKEMIYDDLDRLVGAKTALGTDQVYQYDNLGNLIHAEVSGYPGKGPVKVLLAQTDYKYDAYQHKISERRDTLTGAVLETQWFYDGDLKLRRQKTPNGGETSFEYNLAGHLTDTTDALGNKTHNVYDTAGNLKQVEETTTEQVFDNGAGKFNPKQAKYVTTNTYDAVGRLTDTVSSADTVHMFYDSAGQVRGIASTAQGVLLYRYDGFGHRTDVTRNGSNTKTQYTPGGLARDVQSPTSHDTYVYDALGRTTRRTNQLVGKTSEAVSLYDGLGRQYRSIDPNSTIVERTFNDAGLPLTITIEVPPLFRANGKAYTAVDGIRKETYTYDGLGRIVTAETNEGSKVVLKYDGLGRVLEETQSFRNTPQTVKHNYAPDEKYSDLVYPAIAGGGRLRNNFDALGRTTEVTLENSPIANYLYTGTDRFAQRLTPNGVRTRYQYDGRRRLTRVDASTPGGGTPAGQTLWSQTATYIEGLPKTVQEVIQATETAPARVMNTTLTYDADGRVTASSTKQAVSLQEGATVEESTSFSRFEKGRLKEMAEYARDDLGGLIQTARVDVFNYAPDGRINSLSTSGLLKAKSDTAPEDIDAVTSKIDAAGSDKIAVTQKFVYDYKGNLIHDGRFSYSYDYMDRLVEVDDDFAPFRYNEHVFFTYDALGRRVRVTPSRNRVPQGLVRWGGAWEKVQQDYIYDGNSVIAEVLAEPVQGKGPVLLARYFFGAKPNERLRMDRRPENDPAARLETFYFNEDLQGNYRLLTNSSGAPLFTQNREPAPGTEDAAPERPPGDEVYIAGTNIRVPYLNGATRIDGFAGTIYSETTKAAVFNYRSAYVFAAKVDRAFLKASIAQQQNRLLAVFGTMAAVPVLAPVAVTGAAGVGIAGMAKAATVGGLINVGLGFGQAQIFHTEYGVGDAAKEFGTGFVMGLSGGAMQGLQLGFVATRTLDFGANVVGGTVWDVGVNDMGWGESVQNNLSSAAVGAIIGATTGYLEYSSSAAKGTAIAEEIEASTASVEQVPIAKASRPDTDAVMFSKSKGSPGSTTKKTRMRNRELGDAQSAEEELFDTRTMLELRFGGVYPAEILARIESGELKVVMRDFGELPNPRAKGANGFYDPKDPFKIYLNTRKIDIVNGRWSTRMAASVIVHEGVHYLGLGELSAHIAQAQFLVTRFAASISKVDPTAPITQAHMPYISSGKIAFLNAYRNGNVSQIRDYLKQFYKKASVRHRYGVDSFVDAVPLRTGVPDIDSYLLPRANGYRN